MISSNLILWRFTLSRRLIQDDGIIQEAKLPDYIVVGYFDFWCLLFQVLTRLRARPGTLRVKVYHKFTHH